MISCMTATYGRHRQLCQAVSCFPSMGGEYDRIFRASLIEEGEVTDAEMSYVYTWGTSANHGSGSMNQGLGLDERIAAWRAAHTDTGAGSPVGVVDVSFLDELRAAALGDAP
jgi:hypothetical protein